jgi:hypothetical protein
MVAVAVLTSCGGGSTAGGTVADTDISIEMTDIESLSVGTVQQCIDRLTKVVNVDYIKEHDVKVDDESSAVFAIENAISEVCRTLTPRRESTPPPTASFTWSGTSSGKAEPPLG